MRVCFHACENGSAPISSHCRRTYSTSLRVWTAVTHCTRDLRYFALRPADGIVGTWTAVQPSTRDNGCLAVIPASHLGELAEHGDPDWEQVNFGFFAAKGVDVEARVQLEMEPGDTLFFHPLLIHGSGRNRSDGFRRAISVHYAALECERPKGMTSSRPAKRRIATAIKRIPPPFEGTH